MTSLRPSNFTRVARKVWGWLIFLGAFAAIAVLGPILLPYNPLEFNPVDRLLPPGSTLTNGTFVLFGTDQLGRDLLTEILAGARVSLIVGVATIVPALLIGAVLGLLAGFRGGWLDNVIMRLADIQLALPSFLMAVLIAASLGPSLANVIITLALTRWVVFARVVRSVAVSVREREYVDAARLLGFSPMRLILTQILPMTSTPLLVVATVQFGLVILAEASLSFLGLGTPDTLPSWGLIIAEGRDHLANAWWISTIPGLFLATTVVCVGIFGDRLRDALDPQTWSTRGPGISTPIPTRRNT